MLNFDTISIKSKFGVEFRWYSLKRQDVQNFDSFYKQIEAYHHLGAIQFVIFYTDPEDYLLPINNDDNLAKAISSAKHITLFEHNQPSQPHDTNSSSDTSNGSNSNSNSSSSNYNNNIINNNNNNNNNNGINVHNPLPNLIRRPFLKLLIEKKGTFLDYYNGNLSGKQQKKNQPFKGISNLILPSHDQNHLRPSIGMPEDFRQVSSIIDVDIVPETCRRVRIVKHGSDRPLGFYIRDGTYKRMNDMGQMELVTGIFISRLVPGGLAESTGLLAVNDEVLEVNGIQVTQGKTLDQVTDMMVANSSNLIITIRPGKLNLNNMT